MAKGEDYENIADIPIDPTSDRVQPRQVGTGVTRGVQYLGSDKVYSDGPDSRIIVEDDSTIGVPTVLMGQQDTFGPGFYVAKAGIDAVTNTDPNNWIFNSNQNALKVVQTDTVSVRLNSLASGITLSTPVAHNKGYPPRELTSVVMPSSPPSNYTPSGLVSLPTAWIIPGSGGIGGILLWVSARVDNDNLYLDITNTSTGTITGPYDFSFKYYLLQESAI